MNKAPAADHLVGHDVGGAVRVARAPVADHGDEVGVVDRSIRNDVGDAFASVWIKLPLRSVMPPNSTSQASSIPLLLVIVGITAAFVTLVRNVVGVDVLACPGVDVRGKSNVAVLQSISGVDEVVLPS